MPAWHSLHPNVMLNNLVCTAREETSNEKAFSTSNARETKEEHLRVLHWMSWPASKRENGNGVKQTIPMPAHSLVALGSPSDRDLQPLCCADKVFAVCHDSWVFSNREHKLHTHCSSADLTATATLGKADRRLHLIATGHEQMSVVSGGAVCSLQLESRTLVLLLLSGSSLLELCSRSRANPAANFLSGFVVLFSAFIEPIMGY